MAHLFSLGGNNRIITDITDMPARWSFALFARFTDLTSASSRLLGKDRSDRYEGGFNFATSGGGKIQIDWVYDGGTSALYEYSNPSLGVDHHYALCGINQ